MQIIRGKKEHGARRRALRLALKGHFQRALLHHDNLLVRVPMRLMRHLAREDNDVFGVPKHFLTRDVSQPHEPDEACIASLVKLYHKQDEDNKGERYYAQFRVAEHLLEFDEKFSIWRFHHVKMVERTIGRKAGTGGSSGADYLRDTLFRPLFPDLWAIRSEL